MRKTLSKTNTLGVVACFIVVNGIPAVSWGQTENQKEQRQASSASLEEVVITGSRVKREDLTSSSPVSSFGSEEVQFSGSSNISDAQNLKKIMHGRLDLFAKTKEGMDALCKEVKFDCDELVPVLNLDDISSALYIAYGQNTDKNLIDRTRLAYKDALEKTIPGGAIRSQLKF